MSQGLDEGKCSYRGRSVNIFAMYPQKSAEVIIATSNEPIPKEEWLKLEVSHGSEGPNIKQLLCRIDPPTGGSYRQMQQERKENRKLCKQLMQY